jgi:hypothetical protein
MSELYLTISKADEESGIRILNQTLPNQFQIAKKKSIKVLNFQAFYRDHRIVDHTCPDFPKLIIRSDSTELKANFASFKNQYNDIVCLSGDGFFKGLEYEIIGSMRELIFQFGDPLFPKDFPVHVFIQLLLEFK